MTVNPDGDALSEWERDILEELAREIETDDPSIRILVGVFLTAVGAVVALLAFTVSGVVAIMGLATMGLGIGVGVAPGMHALRKWLIGTSARKGAS